MVDFIARVTEHSEDFTKSHRDVANYFLYNLDKVAVGTLEELAAAVGVSTTTIIRFARKLGYSGFTELQKAAQAVVFCKEEERRAEELADKDTDHLLKETFERDIRNIEETMRALKQEDLDLATDIMMSADNLYIFGLRMAFSLAYHSFASWGRMRKNLRLIHSTGMYHPEEMLSMKAGDACVIFIFPRYVAMSVQYLHWMKKRGVKIILVTAGTYNADHQSADVVLSCRVKSGSYQNSYAAPMALINYFTMAMVARSDEAATLLKDSEELLGPGYYL